MEMSDRRTGEFRARTPEDERAETVASDRMTGAISAMVAVVCAALFARVSEVVELTDRVDDAVEDDGERGTVVPAEIVRVVLVDPVAGERGTEARAA